MTIAALVAGFRAESDGRFQEIYCVSNNPEQAQGRVLQCSSHKHRTVARMEALLEHRRARLSSCSQWIRHQGYPQRLQGWAYIHSLADVHPGETA